MDYIVGVKYTHDSAVALIQGDKLVFSVEGEKINNNVRYKAADDLNFAQEVMFMMGANYPLPNKGIISVDGWREPVLGLPVAPYAGYDADAVKKYQGVNYVSYPHVTGHIIGSYVTAPFSGYKVPAAVVTWDGGQVPRLDIVHPDGQVKIRHIANLLCFKGYIYGIMGYYAGPFKNELVINGTLKNEIGKPLLHTHGVPGKLMSYIALGKPNRNLVEAAHDIYADVERFFYNNKDDLIDPTKRGFPEHRFMQKMKFASDVLLLSDADLLATVHQFLEEKLVERIKAIIPPNMPLIFTGGSALNIKWNTALVESGHFNDVWVSPFPNDAGSAIGAAACVAALENNVWSLNWSAYCGPDLIENGVPADWLEADMSPFELGSFIGHNENEAVVTLYGRSEIGPRALGHRSLLMSPVTRQAKSFLNMVKKREDWRPVAPICLYEDAYKAFKLVKADRFMLYDHVIKNEWKEKIPAIVHIDDTARVQVVTKQDSAFVNEVLEGFKSISGFGILCNTSANYNGRGFFPDAMSAATWASENGVNYVWANGILYTKVVK